MSERWKIEDHGEYLDVTAPNGGNAAFFGGTGDYIGRFAYFAIRQLLADLRERDAELSAIREEVRAEGYDGMPSGADCVHVMRTHLQDRVEQAERERGALAARLRTTAQVLIDAIGSAGGPENAEDAATRVAGVIESLSSRLADAESRLREIEGQEPVAWALKVQGLTGEISEVLSWTRSGAGVCYRLTGQQNERPLYAAPVAPKVLKVSLPEPKVPHKHDSGYCGGWNDCLAEVKRLNGVIND